ncbi:hypothetical protein [Streptomyces capoamus]|uniref:hypothetical protein n=1 Tax=Streptomyces capoamus TaxID=68183 RepID=UPI0016758ECE|nr:hypothetical protein [Streptomyces capoamus]
MQDDHGGAWLQFHHVIGVVGPSGTEVEADTAGQAAHRLLGLRVHLPVVGVDIDVGLHVERRELPGPGVAARHPPFGGSDVAVGVDVQGRGEQVDG